jgi:hypothetical protein
MSVSPIGSHLASAAQRVASGNSASASSAKSAVAAAVEEANESKATTIKEAQNGDRVAQQKMRALEAKQQQQTAPPKASEPGKGSSVDHDA